MMEPVLRVDGTDASPYDGKVIFDKNKLIWNVPIIILALFLAPLTFSFDALFLCISLTYITLLVGHSVGMHRMMIHRSFKAPKPVERILIYIGVLVGMSGPYGIIKIHDLRDWAQRQSKCHPFFAHTENYFKDIFWQLTSTFKFTYAPKIKIESNLTEDKCYIFLEKTWKWHQLIIAIPLYFLGGWSWVVWGTLVRISLSIIGHWSITYFCHNPGKGNWDVKGASVQASNISGLGFITYGECWHNNHHAFPESAKIGLEKNQLDPSWWFIKGLYKLNLVSNIRLPREKAFRTDLRPRR